MSLGSIPRWLAIAGIAIASRLVSTAILLWFAAQQPENPWTAAHPDLFEFSRIWDSHWYRIIAESGYPSELPVTDDGHIGENAWAFLPVFPFLVRFAMGVTGLPFAVVSVVISVAAFVGFLFVADRLMRRTVGDRGSLTAIAVIAFSPVSPVFQVGYAESLSLLLLAVTLLGLSERRWGLAVVTIPLAALSRPLGVPLALTVAVVTIFEWRSRRDRAPLVGLTIWAGIAALAWPGIAWWVTGRMTAYLDTELAWRRGYVGDAPHGWGTGWWDSAMWWFHDAGPWVIGALALVAVVIASLPATRHLGRIPLAWSASYLFYLVMVVFPQSSIFRLLAPLFPLAGVVARGKFSTTICLALGVVGQFFWVLWFWSVQGSDWTPP